MFKIRDIQINGKVILAPMAGITTASYRKFAKPFGVALSYTEMVSDMGLIYNNQVTFSYLSGAKEDRPIAIQLFGNEKESLVKAVEIVEQSTFAYDLIDINLGCPVPKVTRGGGGSAWLKRPSELFEMMEAVVKASAKPVSAKIRLGYSDQSINFKEVIQGLEEAGVAMIALHLRTKEQLYRGKVDYEIARDLGKNMKVPLIISGDIYTLDDAIKAIEVTGASGVMVARGGIGNPHLIKQIDHYFKTGEKLNDATLEEQLTYMREYAKMLIKEKGETTGVKMLRSVLPKFLNRYPHMKQFKIDLVTKTHTYADIEKVLVKIESGLLNKEFNL
ncbi:MAG: tRNA-dihydrouridine synthase family protein [Erysipelotrichaceae bacterium]|nr:tRNA-dihydrouridine synthase family protein [Erysipelotrichaceae bacterium]